MLSRFAPQRGAPPFRNKDDWGLHYRRDEDDVRQTRQGGRVLATLNNLTIGVLRKLGWENIAQARRHYNAWLEEALNLLMQPLPLLL